MNLLKKEVKLHCTLIWNPELQKFESNCVEIPEITSEGETEAMAVENLQKQT